MPDVAESTAIDVHRLHLTDVTPAPHLPWTRPTYPVFGFLVLHPTGPILIDTGVGVGNTFIDELYSPVHHDIDEALDPHGVGVDDIATVITSHLHFDHCGQNDRFGRFAILVQRAEVDAAQGAALHGAGVGVPAGRRPLGHRRRRSRGTGRRRHRHTRTHPRAPVGAHRHALTGSEPSCAARPHGT